MKPKILSLVLAACFFALLCLPQSANAQGIGNTTADITFTSGALSLEDTSSISFDEHDISAARQEYYAIEDDVFININDLRGTGAGWSVTAKADFFRYGEHTLDGAYIVLSAGKAVSSGTGGIPDVVNNIRLDCNGTSTANIASAPEDTGLGLWRIVWSGDNGKNNSVKVSIPGGVALAGTYTSIITWTLSNAP